MRMGYFPGCSLEGTAREYDESIRAIAPLVGWELEEVADWNCCGASAAHCLNHKLALALPARILALAEKAGLEEILVPCSACFNRLAGTRRELRDDPHLRAEISELIELEFTGRSKVVHVLTALSQLDQGALAAKFTAPFHRKVACYYGCYLTRPGLISTCRRAEDPQEMDELMRAAGAEPIDWAFKVECCGAGLSVTRVDVVADLSGRIVEDAARRGAEAIVVACPMCHSNLDLRRPEIERSRRHAYPMPVLYLTQVIGLAMGLTERSLGLHRHFVPVRFAEREAGTTDAKAPVAVGTGAGEH